MNVSRRDLLLRFGPAALLVLPVLRSSRAEVADGIRRRFVTFFSSSGVHQPFFWPNGSPGAWDSGSYDLTGTSLEGLTPYLQDIVIPKGISINRGPGDSHNAGSIAALTGDYLASESGQPYALRESIDRWLARELSIDCPVPYLLQGVRLEVERPSKYVSFDDNGSATPYQQDPYQIYDTVFKNLVGDCQGGGLSPELTAALSRRLSVLDLVREETRAMKRACGFGQDERIKLEQMEESIRSVERRLEAAGEPVVSENCQAVKDEMEAGVQVENTDANFPDLLRLHVDLLVLALELDITRVGTISLSLGGSGGAPMNWLQWEDDDGNLAPIEAGHHNVTHGLQRNVENHIPKLRVIDRWNFDQFAYLIGKLKSVQEGESTMLDNTIAWYSTDVGDGGPHNDTDMPFIVAGRGGGLLETGRYVQLADQPNHQRLLLTFLHKLGFTEVEEFGRPGLSAGGILL
jgi:hypothetical protein